MNQYSYLYCSDPMANIHCLDEVTNGKKNIKTEIDRRNTLKT